MSKREREYETPQIRQRREASPRARRKRRRKKKLIRALLIILLILMGVFLLVTGIFIGRFLSKTVITGTAELPWSVGSVDIVLDAGHGGKDQGTSYENVIEKDLTLEIAEKAQKILEDAGYRVGMVREDDTFVDLGERAEYANRRNAKVYVSIHCNSSEDGEGEGIETYYTEQKDETSQELAQAIQEHVIAQTEARDREVKAADYAVIVRTEMPAALVEVGFLSDSSERELLQQEQYQNQLAEGIAAGVLEYFEAQNLEGSGE